jgi:hypothetical protein
MGTPPVIDGVQGRSDATNAAPGAQKAYDAAPTVSAYAPLGRAVGVAELVAESDTKDVVGDADVDEKVEAEGLAEDDAPVDRVGVADVVAVGVPALDTDGTAVVVADRVPALETVALAAALAEALALYVGTAHVYVSVKTYVPSVAGDAGNVTWAYSCRALVDTIHVDTLAPVHDCVYW